MNIDFSLLPRHVLVTLIEDKTGKQDKVRMSKTGRSKIGIQ